MEASLIRFARFNFHRLGYPQRYLANNFAALRHPLMDSSQLYDYLLQAKARNVTMVLTFDDDDRYALDDVDLCFSIGRDDSRETEPLVVAFDDCKNDSQKRLQAYRDGRHKTAGVYWTSIDPIEPVNMEYSVENLVTIWDDDKNYFVYDRRCDSNNT